MTTIPYIVLESKGELGIRRRRSQLCTKGVAESTIYYPVLTLDTWQLAITSSFLRSLRPSGEPNFNSHSRFPKCREKDLPHIGDHAHI